MNYLEYMSVWNKLEEKHKQTLLTAAVSRVYKKGEILHNGSEDCMGLILVCNGQLRAYTVSEDGREITIYRLFERDFCLFAASCMMNSLQFDIIIKAEKDTEVLIIPPDIYKGIMEISAPLANYTSEIMATRFSDVMWLIDQIMWRSFDKRLADFLLNEISIESNNTLQITHEIIGNHLGSPREVVTRMLKYFQSEGFVKLSRGTVEVIDADGLRKICE